MMPAKAPEMSEPSALSDLTEDCPSWAQIRALVAGLPVPAVVQDLGDDPMIRFVNPAFSACFGYTLADMPTASAWAAQACPDAVTRLQVLAQWQAQIEQCRISGQPARPWEYRIIDKAGRIREVLLGLSVLGGMAIVTVQDLTGVRDTEQALASERQKSEATVWALTENMPGGAYTMVMRPGETKAQFAFLSRQFLTMLDLTRDEVLSGAGMSRLHPDDRSHWRTETERAFANKAASSIDARYQVHGQTRWLRAECVPRPLEDGSTLWEGIAVDITALKETEQKLQVVISAARAMTWNLDLQAGTIEFTEGWATLHGYPPDHRGLALQHWTNELHPDDVGHLRLTLDRLRSGQSEAEKIVYRRRHRDGHWLWLQVHGGVSARGPDGKPTALSGVSFDITQEMTERLRIQDIQAQLREDLQRAQQRETVAQVAGGVAHGVNNLIAVVAGTLEMLQARADGQPWLLDGLGRIRRSVDMARDMIDGLGGMVRPDHPRDRQDLRKMLQDAVDLLGAGRVSRHGVRIELPQGISDGEHPDREHPGGEHPDRSLPVWAAPTEIIQVILNLARNACDAGGPGHCATVTLSARPAGSLPPSRHPDVGDRLPAGMPVSLFTVSDIGMGVTDAMRAQMFRPNFAAAGRTGSGLGLLIVATLLQGNRAALWLDSTPGSGTTVTVAWPTGPEADTDLGQPDHGPVADSSARTGSLNGVHALVVDDLPDVAEVLVRMLEGAGAIAFAISDPAEAQQLLADAPELWSVLLTDLHMPGMDGRALARFANALTPPVPVVLLTARPETVGSSPSPEFAAVLSQPVSGRRLAQVVREAAMLRTRHAGHSPG